MPRVALSPEQKKIYKVKDLAGWIDGRMRSLKLSQKDVAESLGITQSALSTRLNPNTYKNNKRADPFKYGELLILFRLLQATPEEKDRLLTL